MMVEQIIDFYLEPDSRIAMSDAKVFDRIKRLSLQSEKSFSLNGASDLNSISVISIENLVDFLTCSTENEMIQDFLIFYRSIVKASELASLLSKRLAWAIGEGISDFHKLVRLRTFVILRYWIREYWNIDFVSLACRNTILDSLENACMKSRFKLSRSSMRMIKVLQTLLGNGGDVLNNFTDNTLCSFSTKSNTTNSLLLSSSSQAASSISRILRKGTTFSIKIFRKQRVTSNSCSNYILSNSSQKIAIYFSLIEWEILSRVNWLELLEMTCPLEIESPFRCANLVHLVERFNTTSDWIINTICRYCLDDSKDSLVNQILHIEKFIRIAKKCLDVGNFNTFMQIMLALQNPLVEDCKEAWKHVSNYEMRFMQRFVEISSPMRNFQELRQLMGTQQRTSQVPIIPFTGLYISDLVFTWERCNVDSGGKMIDLRQQSSIAKVVRQFQSILFQDPPTNIPAVDRNLYEALVFHRRI